MNKESKSIRVVEGLNEHSLDSNLQDGWTVVGFNRILGSNGQVRSTVYVLERPIVHKYVGGRTEVTLKSGKLEVRCHNSVISLKLAGSHIGTLSFNDAVRLKEFLTLMTEYND